jgi:hypothetical protein
MSVSDRFATTKTTPAADPAIERFFVCVGAQKAGTTWLAKVLAGHPDLFLTPVKEIHYFDHLRGLTQHLSVRKRRSRYRKYFQRLLTQWGRYSELRPQLSWYRRYMRAPVDDRWYTSLFAERLGRTFAGEATPEYAIIGEEGFRHLRRLSPSARILFIMREPVARAWSQVLHRCRSEGRDAARMSSDEILRLVDDPRFAAFGDYPATIANLERVFPAEQVKLLFYEDIHAGRLAALEEVCAFIGCRFEARYFPGHGRLFNRSQEVAAPEVVVAGLRERNRGLIERIAERVGRVPEVWNRVK